MHDHQRRFLELALARNALRFGEFTLKSGRVSPYFFNAGAFDDGAVARRARPLLRRRDPRLGHRVRHAVRPGLQGHPAGRGRPRRRCTAQHGINLPFAFNRKEAKDHGEGGAIVGRALAGRVLIVDDVITAGTAIRESIELIRRSGATPGRRGARARSRGTRPRLRRAATRRRNRPCRKSHGCTASLA